MNIDAELAFEGGEGKRKEKKNSLEKKDGRNGSESAPQMVGNCLMTSLKLLEDSEERQFYETPTHTHTHTHTHTRTHTHTHTHTHTPSNTNKHIHILLAK